MSTEISKFIKVLQQSKLQATCPNCSQEFSLSKALLFDGTKKFPEAAEVKRLELLKELDERIADLVERQKNARTKSEKTAMAVGIGKIIEKILPTNKNFTIPAADCRFLGEPIDMIVFDGISQNTVEHITFLDVKTGDARLNPHQKMVRDAISDHKVAWREV